jgi:hypothetical protein
MKGLKGLNGLKGAPGQSFTITAGAFLPTVETDKDPESSFVRKILSVPLWEF